jgi:hypothetical protein
MVGEISVVLLKLEQIVFSSVPNFVILYLKILNLRRIRHLLASASWVLWWTRLLSASEYWVLCQTRLLWNFESWLIYWSWWICTYEFWVLCQTRHLCAFITWVLHRTRILCTIELGVPCQTHVVAQFYGGLFALRPSLKSWVEVSFVQKVLLCADFCSLDYPVDLI